MEIELKSLIEAWKVCFNSLKTSSNLTHQDAINYIENFKQNSTFLLDIGIYLATQQCESSEMAYFGIQLIIHAIKSKWNEYNDQVKFQMKSKMINLISGMDNAKTLYFNGPNYLKNAVSTVLIELLKREWPQCWPTFLDELFSISFSDSSIEAKKIVFIILKFIAEEFIIEIDTNIPSQRRKDIVTCLNVNMEKITNFYLDNLEFLFNHLQQPGNSNDSIINLTKSCLDSLNFYMNWISINNLFSRNYLLMNILLTFLNHDKLYLETAACLISLVSRKSGQFNERKLLILLFDPIFLNQILACIKKSIENEAFKSSLKYLVKILVGLGHQLCNLNNEMTSQQTVERPDNLLAYLNSILELVLFPNKIYSNEAVQLWNTILMNEHLKKDKDVLNLIDNIAKMLTNSNVMFKISNLELNQDLDTEESDFSRFFQKYRNDLGRLISLASTLNIEPFLTHSNQWTLKIINDTSNPINEQSGFDSNSLLYMSWDSLVFLWNTLIQVITKKMRSINTENEMRLTNQLKMNLIYLLDACIKLKPKNPNFSSFNLSLMSCLLQSSEFFDFAERDRLFKLIFEKLFDELAYFKNESLQIPSTNQAIIKCYMNVRRQTAANVLNICKNYNKDLKSMLTPLYEQVNKHIECTNSTQMEKIILIQALIYLSNQLPNFETRISFIYNLINPSFIFFTSEEFQLAIKDLTNFVNFIGLNDSLQNKQQNSPLAISNRKQIFYHVNLLFAILKSLDLNSQIDSTNQIMLETNLYPFMFKILDVILNLFKCFNMTHGLSQTDINQYYLNIPESAKNSIAGTSSSINQQGPTTHGPNTMHMDIYNEDHNNSEKCLMFFYNTYETLNQLIGLYLTKFKNELVLTELDETKLAFVYKLGDALFCNLDKLPNFRVRLIIRYILRACLLENIEPYMIEKQFVAVRMNLVFLEFFFPNIFTRITDTNKYNAEIKEKNDDEPAIRGKNYADLSEQTRNQIIEENIFSVMCRDVVDLIKIIFNFRNPALLGNNQSIDENNTEQMENNNFIGSAKPKDVTNTSGGSGGGGSGPTNLISDLAVYLLKNSKIIYQSMLLCLFEGLNWPDSYCCSRLVRINLSMLEFCYFSEEEIVLAKKQIDFNLNEQATEQIFLCCLFALQTHGEDAEIANLLINLAFNIYQKLESKHKSTFNKILLQIPNINMKFFEELSAIMSKPSHSNQKSGNSDSKEKAKKDLFKKLLQPIIGKSLSQLKKNDVSFRQLPVYSNVERKKAKFDIERVNELLEYNICSLFDSN